MKVLAFNGSPRKKEWNTISLLTKALEGAASAGAETDLIQLYALDYSGCNSCFSCKKKNRKQDGVCSIRDDLTPVLNDIKTADALIIGTPVYWHAETAATRAFLERLFFPYYNYSKVAKSLFPRKIQTALIYTMNVNEEIARNAGYDRHFELTRMSMEMTFGHCELQLCGDTLQYSDYSQYDSEAFDEAAKLDRRKTVFPEDLKRAFNLGVRLGTGNVNKPVD